MASHQRYDLPQPHSHPAPKEPGRGVKAVLLGAFVVVTALILVTVLREGGQDGVQDGAVVGDTAMSGSAEGESGGSGPIPQSIFDDLRVGELPPGGPFSTKGSQKYRTVGTPGERAGTGTKHKYTYVVEVEDTIDAATYGGDDAFAAIIDATLANPKSWIADKAFSFQHVDAKKVKNPDYRFQLSSTDTTHELCGNSYKLETSCFYRIGNRVVINQARWVRGAAPFHGDLGSYRQYVINHELGHGIGYAAHTPCDKDGALAPIMMQQTLSMRNSELYKINPEESYKNNGDTCRPNPWPYPSGKVTDVKQ
ncbi:DUF3152 domain-containing protein [Corynebacterium sp. zg254]|uniref:DUF3152 domain-containing protein n=1 Tax=Corynebacterium zhongnanshanii TaxID=2768834 RepID=A0ABQ6VFC7_9CORY|nr:MULTISPECIES: DUF3152 domain-containing protein [Corynebacterium]KAB3522995.1 DUF3152 domain-containing protein [Corynebacterium zhongnanshanii]MCR5913920.1 DUF3152 domain-containing protein [Corynebacterium sp. zg254]